MTKQYILQEKTETFEGFHEKNLGGRTERVPYILHATPSVFIDVEGKRVVFFRNSYDMKQWAVIVPGVVVSPEYRTEFGKPAIDVEPIVDAEFRRTLEERLRDRGKVNFWPSA